MMKITKEIRPNCNELDNELLVGKLIKEAKSKFRLLRGISLQCGHTDEEMLSGKLRISDSWLLVNAIDQQKQIHINDSTYINSHPLADNARESTVKDTFAEEQKAAKSITELFGGRESK